MLREYLNVWWFSTTVGEGRLWERLRIYSGKLFIAIKCKNVQHVKIYLACSFEVNPITHFGVIVLFSSNFQNFNTFRPLFQKL